MITELMSTSALTPTRTMRKDEAVLLTTAEMGEITPLLYSYLLREDQVTNGRVTLNVSTTELTEMPVNGIAVTAHVWLVPMLALEQFGGSLDRLNKAYTGTQDIDGVVPTYFEKNKWYSSHSDTVYTSAGIYPEQVDTLEFDGSAAVTAGNTKFYQTMGIHLEGSEFNNTLVQAYNVSTNSRYSYLSKSLVGDALKRNEFDHTFAKATWPLNQLRYIVPDFDDRFIDGEAAVSMTFTAPIKSKTYEQESSAHYNADGTVATASPRWPTQPNGTTIEEGDWMLFSDIVAELSGGGGKVSMRDLENAKKTAAFAKIRAKYSDRLSDDDIVGLLMDGISVPMSELMEAMLLKKVTVPMVYNQQYATDAANLDDSVTRGYAQIDCRFKTPRINGGGTIIVTLEVVPEQLYERKEDYWLANPSVDALPSFVKDYLDPQKVETIMNKEIDVNHTDPNGIFGYAPLNSRWKNKSHTRVGGKYYRPANDAYDENRAKIFTAETSSSMTLNEDFYLVSGLHKKMFADQVTDGLEISGRMSINIAGNTVFGQALMEATNDYDVIDAEIDHTRITPAE
jgi:hypothetical protein